MAKILSQDEIDALLSAPRAADAVTRKEEAPTASFIRYNFRRPDRISKEQIHALHFLHERFARNVSQSMAAYLRSMTDLTLVSVEQFAYSEFLMSLSDPTAFYAISLAPFDDLGGLEINPAVAFAMVERMLGGEGKSATLERALTDIEQNVVDSVVKLLIDSLSETWRPVVDLTFAIRGRETRPQMLQVASPNDTVVMLVFDMRIGDAQGMINLCLPASVVEKTDSHFAGALDRHRREPTPKERVWLHENLSRVPMPVTALLESRCTTRELVDLGAGDIVSLGIPVARPLDLRIGRTLKFRGRPTVHDGRASVVIQHRTDGGGVAEGAEG
ncbi:MAG: flagellar motor switch protein FliM [Vicinamibacterales bacterium]